MLGPFRPFGARLRRLARLPQPEFFGPKAERVELSAAEAMRFPPALALPGQVERIADTMFASKSDTINVLTRTGVAHEGPTLAWHLRDVDLIDGVLYHGGGEYHLRRRQQRLGLARRPRAEASGPLYETWASNRWFGSWLMDAPLTYDLALAEGTPLTTEPSEATGHRRRYKELLDMRPQRLAGDVHFAQLTLFDDTPNNSGKAARARRLRARLLEGRNISPLPGVFLLRGTSGDQRLLENEGELAERLAKERGFRVIDPMQVTVDELIEACAGAASIIGVEGSHLVHGITVAPDGAAVIPIQPPQRVAATLKQMTDRLNQRYGLLVAEGGDTRFRLAWEDLARTLDLFDA